MLPRHESHKEEIEIESNLKSMLQRDREASASGLLFGHSMTWITDTAVYHINQCNLLIVSSHMKV